MKCGIALKAKEYTNGLSREDVNELFNVLETNEAFPIELESRNTDFIAVGFITPPAAEIFEYEYKSSGLADYIALILDHSLVTTENVEYIFRGVKIHLYKGD